MEKDRTIIVIILSMLVILVYFQFFTPKPVPKPAPQPARRETPQPGPETPAQPPQKQETPVVTTPSEQPVQPEEPLEPPVPLKGSTVRTPTLEIDWKNGAAAFSEVTLTARKDNKFIYPDHTRENPLRLLFSEDGEDYTLRLCKADSIEDIAPGNWKVIREDASEFVMEARVGAGLKITKRFTFSENSYYTLMQVKLRNESDTAISPAYRLLVVNGILDETGSRSPGGSVVAQRVEGNLKVNRTAPSKLTKEKPSKEYTAGGAWAGLENMYFAAVVVPEDKVTTEAVRSIIVERAFEEPAQPEKVDRDKPRLMNMRVILQSREILLNPGEEKEHRYFFFTGPKQEDVLQEHTDIGLDELLDFGKFGFLSKIFLWILRGIYYIIPNWGIAVIILTLIVRLCLHPVSRKSQMTMQRYQLAMQKLKPKLDKLKEKHKNNRQKLTKEQMKLYKEEGVSMFPAGGCLLMLLQIPVFIGLYWALSLSIELRQASFFWWINDLSQPDAAFKLSGNIPLLGTACVNILPIIMLVTMIVQQKTQPRSADPQQAQQQKMTMYIMLFVIGFIFYSMPSGLVLYFLTSTLVGIGETKLIKRKLAAEAQES
jgi:YidC/Oxa1 family membrane protein insertase